MSLQEMGKRLTLDDLIPENFDTLLNDVMDHRHTYYILKGGRGSCKSSFVSIAIILMMTKPENRDKHCIVFRKTANTLRDSVFAQMQFAISTLHLEDWFRCTVSPMKIVYIKTGQTITFRGVDDKMKLKSLKAPFGYYAFAWLEECDTFSGMNEIRNILQSSMRGGKDYWTFMSFNPPKSRANFMNSECDIIRPDRVIHSSDYRTVPVEWLGEQFINDAEHLREVNKDAYEHEYLGVANGDGGNVFEYLEIREITDEEIDRMDRIYQGVDWGWYPDAYAFIRAYYESTHEKIYFIDENYVHKTSNEETANWIKEQGYDDYVITCDSNENKSVSDYIDRGIRARAAVKGPGSVEYGFKWLQRRTLVIDPRRTPNTYKEFVNYEYDRDREGNVISGYPEGQDDHTIAATRYAFEPLFNRRGNSA